MDKISVVLNRGVEKIYPSRDALEKLLRSNRKIKLYQGFDPSMPSLHLGNLVGLLKLRQFQDLGHEVIFLVGDFTGMIGDPTDKSATRKRLTREQVLSNAQVWKKQIRKILSFSGPNPAKIMFNSAWQDKLTFRALIEITSNFTVQQLLERDFFRKRLKEGKPIYLHEFLYPVAQAVDCVEMDVDLEVGGNDQTFNMLAGRTLMKALKGKEKFVLTMKLLADSSGAKIGKTTGNAIFLNRSAEDIYGGIMSFPDGSIQSAFELLTFSSKEKIENSKKDSPGPMAFKKHLAFEITTLLFSKEAAKKAAFSFESVVQKKELPKEICPTPRTVPIGKMTLSELTFKSGAAVSHGEAKRLIRQGSVELNNQRITDPHKTIQISGGEILKAGRRKFYKVKTK